MVLINLLIISKNLSNGMLLSVLIPTYNNSATIRRSIESAINQDYKTGYEIVVSDDASTDNTLEIVRGYKDDRIKIVTNKERVSIFDNHRILLEEAQGDYVIFLHADDELLPEALSIISRKLKERNYPRRYILWGHSLFGDVGEWISGYHSMLQFNQMFSGVLAKRLMLANFAPQPTGTIYSRASLMEIDGIWGGDTCSDWGICAWAAYNCFEFEMSERIWLKRTDSGTWKKYSSEEKKRQTYLHCEGVWNKCALINQENDIVSQYEHYDIAFWDNFFFERGTKNEKLEICKKQIKRNPRNVRKWVKYLWVMLRY